MIVRKSCFWSIVFCLVLVCGVVLPNQIFASNTTMSKYEEALKNVSGDPIYINDYDEYEQLMAQFDENEVNKVEFVKQLISELQQIENNSEIPLFQAKVLSISEPEIQYTQDQTTAQFSMGLYQNGEVEIIEDGKLEGVKLNYMICLTYDVYGNITMPEVKVGDIVNITLMQIGEDQVIAFSPEPDTYVKRFPALLTIAVLVLFFVIGFLGKHSIKLIIPSFLIIDMVFGLVGPLVLEGFNLWLLAFFTILLNAIAICVIKLGSNAKAFTAIFSTMLISFVMVIVHLVADALLNFSGLTTESFLMSGGVAPNIIANEIVNIFNFHSLSVVISLLIMFVLVVLTACKTAEKYDENKAKLKADQIISEEVKSYISEITLVGTFVMIANMLPKFMLLLVKSYTPEYVIQSEIFLIEFIRILMMFVAVILTVPVTLLVSKFLED